MATDEEIVRADEVELEPPRRRSNRGFWLIVCAIAAAAIFLIVEILVHLPLNDSIGLAQESLRRTEARAEAFAEATGGFADADASALAGALPPLTFRNAAEASTGVRDVSVSSSETVWAAAVQARPGACFYVRLETGEPPRYGAGEICTGEAARAADQSRW